MKETKLAIAMGYIDDELVSGSVDYRPQKKTRPKTIRWLATAACFVLVCLAAFQIVIDFTGNQSVDIYRVGECKQLESIDFLTQNYSGDLLLGRLNLDDSENIVDTVRRNRTAVGTGKHKFVLGFGLLLFQNFYRLW